MADIDPKDVEDVLDGEWEEVGRAEIHEFKKDKELRGALANIEHGVGSHNSTVYTLEKPNGDRVRFWGSTVIDGRLANVPEGTEVRITYRGKKKSPTSGLMYKHFDILKRK